MVEGSFTYMLVWVLGLTDVFLFLVLIGVYLLEWYLNLPHKTYEEKYGTWRS